MSYDGKVYSLSLIDYREDGIPHGYECDDSAFCITGIEYTFSAPGISFQIYDSWRGQSAQVYGKIETIENFHTVSGICE